eukprot:30385-Pelagococcus_subviridis.AAC.8
MSLTESAFMSRYSTPSTPSFVRAAMSAIEISRHSAGSSNRICSRHRIVIFSLSFRSFATSAGCAFSDAACFTHNASYAAMSPELNAATSDLSHANAVSSIAVMIGCAMSSAKSYESSPRSAARERSTARSRRVSAGSVSLETYAR